jgi:hypothetical protein
VTVGGARKIADTANKADWSGGARARIHAEGCNFVKRESARRTPSTSRLVISGLLGIRSPSSLPVCGDGGAR